MLFSIMISTKISTKILSRTIVDKTYLAADQHRMISEGSCDTEDWDMAAEIQLCHYWNKLHFKNRFK